MAHDDDDMMEEDAVEDILELATQDSRPAPKVDRRKERDFVNAVVVRAEAGGKYLVPLTGQDNKNAMMLLAEMGRSLVKETIEKYKQLPEPMTPKELNDLALAIKNIGEVSNRAYEAHSASPGVDGENMVMFAAGIAAGKTVDALEKEFASLGKKKPVEKKVEEAVE